MRGILDHPQGHDPNNYGGTTGKWLDDLVSHANDASRLRAFLRNQGPARKAARIGRDEETVFPDLVAALLRLDQAAKARVDTLSTGGATQ